LFEFRREGRVCGPIEGEKFGCYLREGRTDFGTIEEKKSKEKSVRGKRVICYRLFNKRCKRAK